MTDDIIVRGDRKAADLAEMGISGRPLTQYMPQDGKGLLALASQVSQSGMFMNGRNPLTQAQAFVIMIKGAELGLSPFQSLEHISIVKGKPFVGAAVMAARIRQHPDCESWDVDCSPKHCTISFKRRHEAEKALTVHIEDIPQSYFKASPSGEPSTWMTIPEDKLFAWTVRRVARRHFPDALLDLGDAVREDREIIDISAVERSATGRAEDSVAPCDKCGADSFLHPSRTGGAYSACSQCGHRQAPPQLIRDAVRGRMPDFVEGAAMEVEPQPLPDEPVP